MGPNGWTNSLVPQDIGEGNVDQSSPAVEELWMGRADEQKPGVDSLVSGLPLLTWEAVGGLSLANSQRRTASLWDLRRAQGSHGGS